MIAIENSAAKDRYLLPASEHVGDKWCQTDFEDSPLTVFPSKSQKTNPCKYCSNYLTLVTEPPYCENGIYLYGGAIPAER
ncbi:hypothetical protein AgCh_022404 [Apium graveolens]